MLKDVVFFGDKKSPINLNSRYFAKITNYTDKYIKLILFWENSTKYIPLDKMNATKAKKYW